MRTRIGRWRPYPEEKPQTGKDGRHLVVLVNGDYCWVAIRIFGERRGETGWYGDDQGQAFVYWFTPLLDDGEQMPPVPNSLAQLGFDRDEFDRHEQRRMLSP